MTTLEARVTALEQDIVVLYTALSQIAMTQSLYTSMTTAQLQALIGQVKGLRDDMGEGDEWKDFG